MSCLVSGMAKVGLWTDGCFVIVPARRSSSAERVDSLPIGNFLYENGQYVA